MDNKCSRCGGTLIPHNDYIYSIDYYMCLQCGNVIFMEDGLGILRYRLPDKKKEDK
jgi:DNA-directed RNA polymerase subunit RPC12/RpoP